MAFTMVELDTVGDKVWKAYATGSAALSESLNLGERFELLESKLHLNAVGGAAEDFTVTENSGLGAAYDCRLHTQDMNAETDDHWKPVKALKFASNDVLDFAWTNTNTKTWGLVVIIRYL